MNLKYLIQYYIGVIYPCSLLMCYIIYVNGWIDSPILLFRFTTIYLNPYDEHYVAIFFNIINDTPISTLLHSLTGACQIVTSEKSIKMKS